MSKHVAQSDRLILLSLKNSDVFRIILILFIHITDTERNITSLRKRLQERQCSEPYARLDVFGLSLPN